MLAVNIRKAEEEEGEEIYWSRSEKEKCRGANKQ
jgi:hypothetical protein